MIWEAGLTQEQSFHPRKNDSGFGRFEASCALWDLPQGRALLGQQGIQRADAERLGPALEQGLHSLQRVSSHPAASSLGLCLSP